MNAGAMAIKPLPVGAAGRLSVGYYGVWTAICTEGALFFFLLFAYYYSAVHLGRALLPDKIPELKLALPNTILLLVSSGTAYLAERAVREDRRGRATLLILVTLALGAVFMGVQVKEWAGKEFGLRSSLYSSFYFVTTGFHMAHVAVGWLGWLAVGGWTLAGYFNHTRSVPVHITAAYWHFVDAVWLVVFFTYYLLPRIW